MENKQAWEQEYTDPQVISKGHEPQVDVVRFMKWLQEDQEYDPYGRVFLDLGCGVGKNSIFLAQAYASSGFGYDISHNAITEAKERKGDLPITFHIQSIAEAYNLEDETVDIVIDSMTSHLLNPDQRNVYLSEVARVLKPGGYFFIRTFTRDGDKNAQNMLRDFPTEHYDTYTHPDLGVAERVFREQDFRELYNLYFDILFLEKQTGYQRWGNQSYKRRYVVAYMQKR